MRRAAIRRGGGRPATSRGFSFDIERLELRQFLSTSIPLNTSSWTFMGPAPLAAPTPTSGRMVDIAAHPTDPNLWYVATAGGGVWKTTNSGTTWTPLTDQQAINYVGSVALAPSNPNILYAGTGEATWGPSKKALNRDNIYYGLGVLRSTDAGSTWTLTGQNEFVRRSIGKLIVDPANPNVVYAAVGAAANNGLPGNTGIWKTIDGGGTWTNTTTSISTTAAFSDLVMDPGNPQVLYAAVGDPDGDAANGLYKSVNAGASWSPVATFPLQNDARLGRITLAIGTSNSQVVYATVAGSGQGGSSVHTHLEFVRTPDAGATWQARTAVAYGGSLDYNVALAVDPTNADTVYVAGQAGAASVQKTTNGGTSWTAIGTGGQSPHPDHHALVFASDNRLLDGNDGGIWRLDNPTPGQIQWSSRNSNLGSVQFVGVALHPTNRDLAYAGAQDNGTERFQDSLSWPIIRGGDGGVTHLDPANPTTLYHTFYYSGPGFLERSDTAGSSWLGVTNGINTAEPAYFYPHYVLDPVETNRLVIGTIRVYESTNRADLWTPISAPFTNGWNTNAIINAVAVAKSDVNTIYATAEGRIFSTTNRGATWVERTIAGVTGVAGERFTDIAVDPTDARVAYVVRGRFGSQGRIWRTTDGGATWSNITGNLPDTPMYSVELDVRGFGIGDDRIWVGNDAGVFVSTNLGGTWSEFGTGLPNAQAKDLEYIPGIGVLAIGTHGRGMWQISVPDITPPTTFDNRFDFATAPHRLSFRFTENVAPSLSLADVTVQNLTTSQTVPSGSMSLAYAARLDTATITFPGFAQGVLPDGRYRLTLNGAAITDAAGNPLAGNPPFEFTFIRGDANGDGHVNLDDFNILAANFGGSPRDFTQGDFNYDNIVNLDDFNVLASRFGTIVAPSSAPSNPFGERPMGESDGEDVMDDLLA
jgi:photosystem II stability/assembly factor-like uncharacterized protein